MKTFLKTAKYKVSYDIFFSGYVFRFIKAFLVLTNFSEEHHGGFFLESAIFFKAISMLPCIDCIVLQWLAQLFKRVQRFVIFIPALGTPMFSVSTAKFKNNLVFIVDISALMWLLASGRQK